jgi:hypothetical protein
MYWRRTAISRLLRGGAMQRYRFAALTDPTPAGGHSVAAWCDFPIEARHNITLDHLDPELERPRLRGDPHGAGRPPAVRRGRLRRVVADWRYA